MAQNENQIGVLGAGLIGMSWAGLFSAFGYDTTIYDPYLKKQHLARHEINNIWASLDLLFDNLQNKKEVKFSDHTRFDFLISNNKKAASKSADTYRKDFRNPLEISFLNICKYITYWQLKKYGKRQYQQFLLLI